MLTYMGVDLIICTWCWYICMIRVPRTWMLFFDVLEDLLTWEVCNQLFIGSDILVWLDYVVCRVVRYESYFLKGAQYNLFDLKSFIHATINSFHSLEAPLNIINIHVRAGAILTMQELAFSKAEACKPHLHSSLLCL